jgi:multidrug efflux system membrane fusion protein
MPDLHTDSTRRPAAARLLPSALLLALALMAGCSKTEAPAPDVRPVRALTLTAGSVGSSAEFSGDVRPRYESRLGFRVGGKISARKVDVGTTVARGDVLMRLDPQDLRLGQAQAQASLRAAQTNAELANAELKRYQDLRRQNFVAQAVLDQKVAAARSGQANVEAARAALSEQANQTAYADLKSDGDGVVTGIDAEVGQVVQAGTPVVRVARTDEKEVVIGVPEDQVEALRHVSDVKVRLWADPGRSIAGRIREVSPVADAATRTYTVKVSIPARGTEANEVRLGMTAVVQLAHAGTGTAIRVPLGALYQSKGVTSVWVIENGAVRLVPVQVGGVDGNEVVLAGGVNAGQQIVTAGVNLLKPGQKVKVLSADVARRGDAEADAVGNPAAATAAPAPTATAAAAPAAAAAGAVAATAAAAKLADVKAADAHKAADTTASAAPAAPVKAADNPAPSHAKERDKAKERTHRKAEKKARKEERKKAAQAKEHRKAHARAAREAAE